MTRDCLADVLGIDPSSVARIGLRFGIARRVRDYTDEQVGQIVAWAQRPRRSSPAPGETHWRIRFGGSIPGGIAAKVSNDVIVYQRGERLRGFVGMTDDQIRASLDRLGGRWRRVPRGGQDVSADC